MSSTGYNNLHIVEVLNHNKPLFQHLYAVREKN